MFRLALIRLYWLVAETGLPWDFARPAWPASSDLEAPGSSTSDPLYPEFLRNMFSFRRLVWVAPLLAPWVLYAGCKNSTSTKIPSGPKGSASTRGASGAAIDDPAAVEALTKLGAKLSQNSAGAVVEVDLSDTNIPVRNDNLAAVKGLPELERIKLFGADYNDGALDYILGAAKLRLLGLERTGVTNDGLGKLVGLSNLESIDLSQASFISDDGLTHLAKLPKLRTLQLVKCNIGDEGVAHLAAVSTLVGLDLRDTLVSDACFESLQGMTKLKSLRCQGSGSRLHDDGLQFLAGIQSLVALGLENSQITDNGLAQLAGLTNLEELYLTRANISDAGLEHLKGLRKLRVLRLRDTGISDAGITHLAALPQLKIVDLSESAVGDDGVAVLARLPALEDLNLWNTVVGDEGVKHLLGNKTLKRLNLDNLGISDDAVDAIVSLENAEWIHLGKSNITNAGLEKFARMPNLKTLIVTFCTSVTSEGVENLKAAKSGLQVEH